MERRVKEVWEGNKMKNIYEEGKIHACLPPAPLYTFKEVSMWTKWHVYSIMHRTGGVLHELDPSSGPAVLMFYVIIVNITVTFTLMPF